MSTRVAIQRIKRKIELMSDDLLTCKPLDSYNEILTFLENPPPWRSLCQELRPHSKYTVSNMENLKHYKFSDIMPETSVDYCHFDPDADDPTRDDGTEKARPKTLVCHDMANGYHDDSHIDGTVNYASYTFYNWAGIDIFCYFSHHLITIPPLGWINVAHAHGVKVIGTIITEWAEGAIFWDKVLESEAKYQQFASAVVAIAKTMKFDGWLLNVENKVSQPEMLLKFVGHLHKLLHSELVDPVLIWYDSVTINGKLNWQNKLNDKNKAFFDVCDGFFVNYSWTIADIESSVMAAGSRVTDVFIGIDIWGRNFYCGGQFNSYEAIKIAYNEGCSLAIFAPAWTFEAMTMDPTEPNYVLHSQGFSKYSASMLRDRALWSSIWPYLHTRLPCHLPFQTSFCRGLGKKRWLYGEVISPGPWYNLRLQQYQPNTAVSQHGYFLAPYDDTRKAKAKASKGIIKEVESKETALEVQQATEGESSIDNDKQIKIVDSLQNIIPEGSRVAPSSCDSIETKTMNKVVAPVKSIESATTKTILTQKRSFLRRLCDLFKRKSNEAPPKTNEGYYKAENIVSHSKVETNAMPGTSYAFKSVDDAIASRLGSPDISKSSRESTPDRKSSMKKPKSPDKAITPSRETSPDRASSPSKASSSTPDQSQAADNTESTDKVQSHLPTDSITSTQAAAALRNRSTRTSMVTTSIYLNLRQPDVKTRWALSYRKKERECLEFYLQDAFTGGASLRVNPSDAVNTWHRTTRLFHCDFKCENMLIACVVTKPMEHYQDQYLNIRLKMKNANDEDLQVILVGRNLGLPTTLSSKSLGIHYSYPLHSEEQLEFRALREYLLLNQPGFYVPIDNFYGWEIRYYKVHVPGSRVLQINCRTELPQGGILLGHIGICHSH